MVAAKAFALSEKGHALHGGAFFRGNLQPIIQADQKAEQVDEQEIDLMPTSTSLPMALVSENGVKDAFGTMDALPMTQISGQESWDDYSLQVEVMVFGARDLVIGEFSSSFFLSSNALSHVFNLFSLLNIQAISFHFSAMQLILSLHKF